MKVRLVIPIVLIIIALIFSGCIHRSKDIPLNRPEDLAGIPYEDTPLPSYQYPQGKSTPTESPNTSSDPDINNVIAEWKAWLQIQNKLDSQAAETLELQNQLYSTFDAEIVKKKPDYELISAGCHYCADDAEEWDPTLEELKAQKERFDVAKDKLITGNNPNVAQSLLAADYANTMSENMDAYDNDMSNARLYIDSSCFFLNQSAQFAKYNSINPKIFETANDNYLESNKKVLHAYDCLKVAKRNAISLSNL
jgi:hypothetical protein